MNKGNKNIFDETVETLIKDAKALTERYNKYVSAEADPDNCAFRNKMTIDTLRLLKDTLSLIKEYDWHLEFSENDGKISVWEQNHSGEIRNKKEWFIKGYYGKFWYKTFLYYICNNDSYIVGKSLSQTMRGSGKSEALARLCHEYRGIVISNMMSGFRAIRDRNEELGYIDYFVQFVKYEDYINNIEKYKDKIVFLDECHGLSCEEIDVIKENNLVIGFEA